MQNKETSEVRKNYSSSWELINRGAGTAAPFSETAPPWQGPKHKISLVVSNQAAAKTRTVKGEGWKQMVDHTWEPNNIVGWQTSYTIS